MNCGIGLELTSSFYNKKYHKEFKIDYIEASKKSQELNIWLIENLNRLLDDYKTNSD